MKPFLRVYTMMLISLSHRKNLTTNIFRLACLSICFTYSSTHSTLCPYYTSLSKPPSSPLKAIPSMPPDVENCPNMQEHELAFFYSTFRNDLIYLCFCCCLNTLQSGCCECSPKHLAAWTPIWPLHLLPTSSYPLVFQ